MKTPLILTLFLSLTVTINLFSQEWEDPVTTTNWNNIWKSSFIQSYNASNAPESGVWFWGLNMNHSSNSSDYKYNGQIAIKNSNLSPTMYFRSTNLNGEGEWAKVATIQSSSIGKLTSINSLRIIGNNLDGLDLSFMTEQKSMLIGWNRSGSHGETNFITYRGGGNTGGFEFIDISGSDGENLLMKISGNGNLGIGTRNPQAKLHIEGNINGWLQTIKGTVTNEEEFLGIKLQTGYVEEHNKWAGIAAISPEDHGNNPSLGFYSAQNERMRLLGNGNLGIGTQNPDSKLTVNGTIHAKEVKIDTDVWPDFVFSEGYKIKPLEEVKEFINKNSHLPEIPSEAEVIENGINLGEMDAKLLQKIEELTLYLINQNDALKEANLEIQELKKEVIALKQVIEE